MEAVRMVVNEQLPSLMPTLYPGVLATVSRPFGILDAMWLVFETLENKETPAINCFCDECAVIRPVGATARR